MSRMNNRVESVRRTLRKFDEEIALHELKVKHRKEHKKKVICKVLLIFLLCGLLYLLSPFWEPIEESLRTLISDLTYNPPSAQEMVYNNLKKIAEYQSTVFSKCGNFTKSAWGITQDGCKAGIIWQAPPDCEDNHENKYQRWKGPPYFERYELDGNSYGYIIFFPQGEWPDDKIPLIAGAIRNLDKDDYKDYILVSPAGNIYHMENDLTDKFSSLPEQVFIPQFSAPFNFCANPYVH